MSAPDEADWDRFRHYLRFPEVVDTTPAPAPWEPPADLAGVVLIPGSAEFLVRGDPPDRPLLLVDPDRGRVSVLADDATLREAAAAALMRDPGLLRSVEAAGPDRLVLRFDAGWMDWRSSSGVASPLPETEAQARDRSTPRVTEQDIVLGRPASLEVPAPGGRVLATLTGAGDVALRYIIDDRIEPLTDDAGDDVRWSVAGTLWDRAGCRLVATRIDTAGVPRLSIPWWSHVTEQVAQHPYARPGQARPRQALFVIDVVSRARTELDLDTFADGIIQPVRWREVNGELLVLARARGSRDLHLLAADPVTGAVRTVHVERDQSVTAHAYERSQAVHDAVAFELPRDDAYLWLTDRNGHAQLERRGLDDGAVTLVAGSDHPVVRAVSVDGEHDRVFLTVNSDPSRPYDTHVAVAQLDGSGERVVTSGPGQHTPTVLPGGRYVVDHRSQVSDPPVVSLLEVGDPDTAPRDVAQLRIDADVRALAELDWEPPEVVTLLAADGVTPLWGVLYHPPGFDPTRRYALVERIYGGPQVIAHPREFSQAPFGILAQALAQLGFVTLVLDGRGTPGRDRVFHDRADRTFGQHEIEDHAAAIRQLTMRRPYLDSDRVGIVGASYGGYMTVRAMLQAPETYRVGVAVNAGAGDVHHGSDHEWFLGLPSDNPDGYRASSNLDLIDRLVGHLLAIHGTADANVPVSATMKLVDAAIRAGKRIDTLLVPDQPHGFSGAAADHVNHAIASYLLDHLADPTEPSAHPTTPLDDQSRASTSV